MKLFGFLIRLIVVVALVIWLADRPGTAQIVWRDMEIQTSAAVLLVIVGLIAYACVLLHRVWRFMWDSPRFWKLNRRIGSLEDGQKEIARGLAAIAAGQPSDAGVHAVKARKLLGETPATRLLQAQAAQLAGDERTAKQLYESMTTDADTAILGYRGLITSALRAGDYETVSQMISRVENAKIDAPWLHLVRMQMSVRLENWFAAERSLELARKGRALPRPQADKTEAALLLAEAKRALRMSDNEKALGFAERAKRLAPQWIPAALVLAETQIVTKHERAALRTVEKAWRTQPHPQLIPLALWALRSSKPVDGYRFVEKLTRDSKDSAVALMALADAALKADLWGEARRVLMKLDATHMATQMTYQMLARLERRETKNERAASLWLGKAVTASPDPEWLCGSCGAAHEYWEARCPSCGSFNSMEWGVPGRARAGAEVSLPLLMDVMSR